MASHVSSRVLGVGAALALFCSGCPSASPAPRAPVYQGPVYAELVLENRLSGNFVLTEASFAFEGDARPVDLPAPGQSVSLGSVTTQGGEHPIALRAVLRGEGSGVFSYLRAYKFEVRAKPKVLLDAPQVRVLCAIRTHEEPTMPLEQRPYADCAASPL
ncbi:MAG: hypothetical protein HOO96_15640 [Polyangiaceae bacterium]|nr:hypothetical protein [Polyangiaceae bacterium]